MKKNKGEGFLSRLFAKPKQAIKDFFYGCSVKIHQSRMERIKRKGGSIAKVRGITRRRSAAIFSAVVLSYSVLHMLLFFVIMPMDGIPMAWKTWDGQKFVFLEGSHLFDNFKLIFERIFSGDKVGTYYLRGIGWWFISFAITFPTSFFFPYICFKKFPGTKMMKVIIYLPNIITSMTVIMFLKGMTLKFLPSVLAENVDEKYFFTNLMVEKPYNILIVFGYSIFMQMPGGLIVNLAAMSNTPPELLESGQLDGLTLAGELWHIVIPIMWPMISMSSLAIFTVFFTGGFAPAVLTFYPPGTASGTPDEVITFPYYVQQTVLGAAREEYGFVAAYTVTTGILNTVTVLFTKKLFDKIDPMK